MIKKLVSKIEEKLCINNDRRELGQVYFRITIYIICAWYSLTFDQSIYMKAIATFGLFGTFFWIAMAYRKIGTAQARQLGAMIYDSFIIGLVLFQLGGKFVGLIGILMWIASAYGLRYRNLTYLRLSTWLTMLIVILSSIFTPWENQAYLYATLAILYFSIKRESLPIMMANNAIAERDKAIHALDRANAIKSMFLANTSHNLLTPLNSVLGYCEMARDKIPEIAPEIEGIRITVDQLSRQIKANIEKSFDLEIHDEFLEEFSPTEMLKKIATVIRPFADNKKVEISIASTIDNDSIYFGALDAITVCMLNLAENAVKYSDGHTIQLSVSKGADNDSLQFSVLDDGQGIPPEDQAKIFDLFYRAKNNDTQGWGLGLSIVKETLDKLGGSIQLQSQPNETAFTFTVPLKVVGKRQKHADNLPELQISKTSAISIMFVDDETPARKAWGAAIRKTGHFVHVAAGGLEALKSIESGNQYHLYMLDYRMPDMNGLELAKHIREIEPLAIIVLISAEANKNNQGFNDAIESGLINATIRKPIHINELLALIKKYQKTEGDNTDDYKTAIFKELATITTDLGLALQTKNDDAADKLSHRAKNLTSFIDDQTTIKTISAAKTPSEVLYALKTFLH